MSCINRQIKQRRLSVMNRYRILKKRATFNEKKKKKTSHFLQSNVTTNSNSDQNYEQDAKERERKNRKPCLIIGQNCGQ